MFICIKQHTQFVLKRVKKEKNSNRNRISIFNKILTINANNSEPLNNQINSIPFKYRQQTKQQKKNLTKPILFNILDTKIFNRNHTKKNYTIQFNVFQLEMLRNERLKNDWKHNNNNNKKQKLYDYGKGSKKEGRKKTKEMKFNTCMCKRGKLPY